MMRLPRFHYLSPRSVVEAADVLASASPGDAMLVAGGTDLIPNMKRRQQVPGTLVGLRRLTELQSIRNSDGYLLGSGVTLTQLIHWLEQHPAEGLRGLRQAAAQVATPHL